MQDNTKRSGFAIRTEQLARVRDHLASETEVSVKAVALAKKLSEAMGTDAERELAVAVEKAELAAAILKRDGQVLSAIGKALDGRFVRTDAAWLFADGVVQPEA
jgi:hypothetical protein